MRQDVTFVSEGLKCAGWLYPPMTCEAVRNDPPLSWHMALAPLKRCISISFAEVFVAAGFVTLVFDYRYQGASGRRAAGSDYSCRTAR